jgi:3-oxoadipate CoA-transferase alpha subunit
MQSKLFAGFDSAVADIADGASILLAGFGPGTPHNLISALYDQGARDLHLIANTAGTGSTAQRSDLRTAADLVAARRVRKVTLAFTAATHPSRRTALEELNEAGEIEAELVPQGTLAERIRAGGAGIPAFYTPAGIGTELAAGREERQFNGRTSRLHPRLAQRRVRQPGLPPRPAQLQPDHGHGRANDDRRSGGGRGDRQP